ncbi:MAG TPA: DNA-processing protein DprA [Solirubrobacteraceae bacterium]|nr:DNA-processing protein DprA [Solirubrobacteraceae bacterium]
MPEACRDCLRRCWLLGELSPVLDRNCCADGRLFELLALSDENLIAALGGRRRGELLRGHAHFGARDPKPEPASAHVAICVHDECYPEALRRPDAPRLLCVEGGVDCLRALASNKTVALLGTAHASDYGLEVAYELGRELAASGVTLVAERRAGIALAAQRGASELNGATVLVSGDGLGVPVAKTRHSIYEQLAPAGCTVSELPDQARGRRWGVAAGVRIAAALGDVTVTVEAEDRAGELRGARLAQALGKPVAALPGRVGSPTSRGCHRLLREGARLVQDASDVLDLLYGVDGGIESAFRACSSARRAPPGLRPELRELLARVGSGLGTLGELTRGRRKRAEVLRDLTELELMGLLTRGDGGGYVVGKAESMDPLRYGADAQMGS